MALNFQLSSGVLPNGRTAYYAKLPNENTKFLVGYKTKYEDYFGLYNTQTDAALIYNPANFSDKGFWAYFIYPTVKAESNGSFFCLNTYDRAKFTFTCMQFAAHVPNGDFVNYLKALLALPLAADYFPKLIVQNNRIYYKADTGTLTQLEDDNSTQKLMDYLNPSLNEIETQEHISAARFVHWAKNDNAHRKLQVEQAIALYKKNMIAYDNRFGLHNVPAKVCQLICDIRHQGRATNDRIALAISTNGDYNKAYNNLLGIGSVNYGDRISTLKSTINSLLNQNLFNKKWSSTKKDFVNI